MTLRWDNINFIAKTVTIKDTKNGEDHTIPLSDFLFELVNKRKEKSKSDYVFPGRNKAAPLKEPRNYVDTIIKNSDVNFMLHDLRRTFATYSDRVVPHRCVNRLMNHKQNEEITTKYTIYDLNALRTYMQTITDYILELATKKVETE